MEKSGGNEKNCPKIKLLLLFQLLQSKRLALCGIIALQTDLSKTEKEIVVN